MNGERPGEIAPGLDQWGLLLVGGDGQVLECDRGAAKGRGVLRDPVEIEARLLDRGGSKQRFEGSDVGALVRADDGGLLGQRTAQSPDSFSLRVERSLQVFERQRDVEDRNVTGSSQLLARAGPPDSASA